jgi:hypothetical protein
MTETEKQPGFHKSNNLFSKPQNPAFVIYFLIDSTFVYMYMYIDFFCSQKRYDRIETFISECCVYEEDIKGWYI